MRNLCNWLHNYPGNIILLQKQKNKIVDYTLNCINKPIGVSEYKIFDKIYIKIRSKLPTLGSINI